MVRARGSSPLRLQTPSPPCPREAWPVCAHASRLFLLEQGRQSCWIGAPPICPHVALIPSLKAPAPKRPLFKVLRVRSVA